MSCSGLRSTGPFAVRPVCNYRRNCIPTLRSLPPVDYPLGIVAGNRTVDPISSFLILPRPNDGKVSVQRTRLDGMADHIVVEASHNGLLRHPAAIEQTIAFLREGRFDRFARIGQAARSKPVLGRHDHVRRKALAA